MIRESLRELVGENVEKKVDIGLAKDGSGVGGKMQFSFGWPSLILLFSGVVCTASYQATSQQVKM
jgi:hypothetical protein